MRAREGNGINVRKGMLVRETDGFLLGMVT
jgi:hypothetical protein